MSTAINIQTQSADLKLTKRLAILGAGESGVGAALLGKKNGYEVFVSDGGVIKELYKNTLQQNNIDRAP